MRHLLALRDLDPGTIVTLLDAAQRLRDGEAPPSPAGATVAMLFYEPSTRTEMSFILAARRLGAEVLPCAVEHSSVRKGESFLDTVRTFEALGADALVIRHPSSGAPHLVARHVGCAVINAGDGMHEHPTQGLVDLLTVRQVKGRIAGLKVAIVGDILHSRVARSAAWGFAKLGASVVLAGPATLLPAAPPVPGVAVTASLADALAGADVVMALRVQLERQAGGALPTLAEYARTFGLTEERLALARPDCVVMHPGPVNLGVELGAAVAEGPRSVIRRQVANGVCVRMAAIQWALGRGAGAELPAAATAAGEISRGRARPEAVEVH
ncbi:MAG: aspartate carbamoyltransferase catalytic subunit [Armatimonadota bacterium]|nr:aspartate carbamoyltransferase catalytic subunit [Armatimonadota bacterium]MDR7452048.1 aspartate carbamoyltransferase catalytic subunit [Armatimonadota bacterium]MDR7466510.1 aspartate carbamoyltransferase catalytic subunit [Armatimonadota bacterium]MDR7493232.1 aspartate carbamoyltransferase catalytic subunit [Armatimonadota bacterium]MDR7499415.1 aspartate carbamoyltransferase catalytic subunit [Armatimonadota bacterium]